MSERKLVRVREVMKTKFDFVDGMMTIKDAMKTMQHVEAKCLIVNKRHEDDEYGILLLSDVARNVIAKDLAVDRVNVYEIMTKPVLYVDPDMDIRYCARFLERFDVSRVPVLENKKIVGIVSLTDLVLKGLVKHM